MLYPEYMKDMQNSYLLLAGNPLLVEDYKSKMLHNNKLAHILNMEIHSLNETNIYYYNISKLRTLSEVYQSITFTKKDIQNLINTIIDVVKYSFEYMLKENDFVIHPDFIYMGDSITELQLCYYSNYNVNIQEQLVQLTEYIMNRVDYKDRQAVLLIYSIYRVMREDNCSYDKILHTLYHEEVHKDGLEQGSSNNGKSLEHTNSSYNLSQSMALPLEERNNTTNVTIENKALRNVEKRLEDKIERKLEQKKEKKDEHLPVEESSVDIYPKKLYILGAIIGVLGIVFFIIGCSLGIFHNSFGTSLDVVKLICGLLILGLGEYYIQSRIFSDKHKISKVILPEYSDLKVDNSLKMEAYNDITYIEPTELITIPQSSEEETILIQHTHNPYYLKPQNDKEYKYIEIPYVPYVIGKCKEEVDYVFNHATISRKHCKFQKVDGELYLTDLGSTNGSFVNHKKLLSQESIKIMDGDTISIANFAFTLHKEL